MVETCLTGTDSYRPYSEPSGYTTVASSLCQPMSSGRSIPNHAPLLISIILLNLKTWTCIVVFPEFSHVMYGLSFINVRGFVQVGSEGNLLQK